MNFSQRNTETEFMDDPGLHKDLLMDVFDDISRSNNYLGGTGITLQAVTHIIAAKPNIQYTILDVGCGDGSMLRALANYARKHQYKLRLIGMDMSSTAVAIAKERSADYDEISYLVQDVLNLGDVKISCDILLCTLTLHHFSNQQIPVFLKTFSKITSDTIVINDLQRSRLAFYLFKVFSAIFIKTKIAKQDGLTSIQSGFTKEELKQFAKALPAFQHRIRRKWAFRYVWEIRASK